MRLYIEKQIYEALTFPLLPLYIFGVKSLFTVPTEFILQADTIIVVITSVTSKIIAVHEKDQFCMLTLPSGALGNESIHST